MENAFGNVDTQADAIGDLGARAEGGEVANEGAKMAAVAIGVTGKSQDEGAQLFRVSLTYRMTGRVYGTLW